MHCRVAYVVKRYPRYSETFIVNEILAHEAAGCELAVFSLKSPVDTHFQDRLARVRASVTYLPSSAVKSASFWAVINEASETLGNFWPALEVARGESVSNVFQAVHLALELHAREITHVHAHFATDPASVARLAASFAGISYSFTAHAKDIFHESVSRDDLARKLCDASGVVTVSDFNASYLQREFGEAAAAVTRVYNGLQLDEFVWSSPEEREPRIVAVGRLVEKKGFGVLVDACRTLADRGRRFRCEIIGSGDHETELRERISRHGLGELVVLTGPRPQRQVIDHVRSASVFAAPCVIGSDGNRDGLPTVLLEAMALGTPCVSTDVTGIPEVIRHGETGLLVAQRDPVGLADAIESLWSDRRARVDLSVRARRLIERNFNIEANTARIRQLFAASADGKVRRAHRRRKVAC